MIAIGMKLQATLAVDDFMPDFDFDLLGGGLGLGTPFHLPATP